jgi:cytochrome c-type biogenesis protein CcmE
MTTQSRKYVRFGAVIAVILVALGYLAYTGVQDSKSYYVTIRELNGMGDGAYSKRLRVAGNVAPGSIKRQGTHLEFQLEEEGKMIPVVYSGTEAPPDTFKDNAQALAEGSMAATGLPREQYQAKCASGYARKPGATPGLRLRRLPRMPHQEAMGSSCRHPVQPNLHHDEPQVLNQPVIVLQDLVKFFGRFAALQESRRFAPGKLYVVVGDNGAGKSTLLRVVAGLMEPSQGPPRF